MTLQPFLELRVKIVAKTNVCENPGEMSGLRGASQKSSPALPLFLAPFKPIISIFLLIFFTHTAPGAFMLKLINCLKCRSSYICSPLLLLLLLLFFKAHFLTLLALVHQRLHLKMGFKVPVEWTQLAT